MTSPWGNVCDREARPSPLGQFLSKLGATKTRSKSPTITLSLKCRTSALPSKGTIHIETTNDKRTLMLDETIITDVGLTRTPPQKPKRTSSPFARVMNRLSMSRKHSGIASNEQMVHDAGSEMLNAKATKSPPPVASVSPSYAASPRPAISESDLRHITLRRGHALASEITPLSGAIPFRSEDNLMGNSSMRTPSYLRVSCALNGYRQYRRLDLNSTPLKTPASALPLSNVQRRTLLFCSPESQRSAPSVSPQTQFNGEMDGAVNTPTPVRQLVARFDKLHVSSGEKNSFEKENHSFHSAHSVAGACKNDENAHLTEQCDTLHHPVTPRSSMPLSSQIPNKVLSNSSPEPVLAQPVHSILQRITVTEIKPHQDNQSEVVVSDRQPQKAIMAERVLNENKTIVELRTGEDYQKVFDKTRAILEKRAKEAIEILDKQENELPEHAAGALRSAAGNATLLLKKKMPRFAELLAKNLNPIEGDTQPATLDDLAGYWALVSMELDDVEGLFAEVDELRKNGWQKATTSVDQLPIQSSPEHGPQLLATKPPVSSRMVKSRGAVAAAPAANNEAKKAAEAKRKRELAEAIRKQKERMLQEKNASGECVQSAGRFIC